MRIKFLAIALFAGLLGGCGGNEVQPAQDAADYYQAHKNEVRLGMSEKQFAQFIAPAEAFYKPDYCYRAPDRYTRNNQMIDVWYVISRIIDVSGRSECYDDEYTPYIFVDGKLAAIGWEPLGGPKRTSQDVAKEQAAISEAKASAPTTQVRVRQDNYPPPIPMIPMPVIN